MSFQNTSGPLLRNNTRRRREGDESLIIRDETSLPQGSRGGPDSGPRGRGGRGEGGVGGSNKMII